MESQPDQNTVLKHISFFAGTRGFELAADMAGWETLASVEINDDLNRRFKTRYPNVKQHKDIKETDFSPYRGLVDVVSGGFPCQPFSLAGERKGTEDERHLWPEMLRGIRETETPWVVGENVRGLVNWSKGLVFEQVCVDLENEGYEVQPFLLPAAGINAPHERYRIFFVAYSDAFQRKRQQRKSVQRAEQIQPSFAETDTGRVTSDTDNKPDFGIPIQPKKGRKPGKNTDASGQSKNAANAPHIGYERGGATRGRRDGFTDGSKVSSDTDGIGSGKILHNLQPEITNGPILDGLSDERNDSNPDIERRKELNTTSGGKESRFFAGRHFDCWDEWTTEPPVCRLDDGLPFGLDVFRLRTDLARLYPTATEKEIERAIQKTATAYRNEMIKAFGNAVVPQLVYRIFLAINQYTIANLR